MTRWYRAYEGTISDPKMGEAAALCGLSRCCIVAIWHGILEAAAHENAGGRYDLPARRLAAALSEPIKNIEMAFTAIEEVGMTKGGVVQSWVRRQFESDSSTDRVRAFRERRRETERPGNVSETVPPVSETLVKHAHRQRQKQIQN